MEILFLDDDARAGETFDEWARTVLGGENHVTFVSNLVDFDYELYESGKTFDKYILDLGLEKPPEFPDDEYNHWLKDIGILDPTYLNPVTSALGWDYYDQVMRERDLTRERLDRVLLKTGYAELLIEKKGKNCYLPATLLNKGDEAYESTLKEFLAK